jgi:hypothetical protein
MGEITAHILKILTLVIIFGIFSPDTAYADEIKNYNIHDKDPEQVKFLSIPLFKYGHILPVQNKNVKKKKFEEFSDKQLIYHNYSTNKVDAYYIPDLLNQYIVCHLKFRVLQI